MQLEKRCFSLNLVNTVLLLLEGNLVNLTTPLLSKDLLSGKNVEVHKSVNALVSRTARMQFKIPQ